MTSSYPHRTETVKLSCKREKKGFTHKQELDGEHRASPTHRYRATTTDSTKYRKSLKRSKQGFDGNENESESEGGYSSDGKEAGGGGLRGGAADPFPLKLHRMLDDVEEDGLESIVSWRPHGRAFCVFKPRQFVEMIMPLHFRQSKITSFQRQLNLYGFQRLTRGLDVGSYFHPLFLRGQPQLCYGMIRTKIKGTGQRGRASPDQEPDFYTMPAIDGKNGRDINSKRTDDSVNSDCSHIHGVAKNEDDYYEEARSEIFQGISGSTTSFNSFPVNRSVVSTPDTVARSSWSQLSSEGRDNDTNMSLPEEDEMEDGGMSDCDSDLASSWVHKLGSLFTSTISNQNSQVESLNTQAFFGCANTVSSPAPITSLTHNGRCQGQLSFVSNAEEEPNTQKQTNARGTLGDVDLAALSNSNESHITEYPEEQLWLEDIPLEDIGEAGDKGRAIMQRIFHDEEDDYLSHNSTTCQQDDDPFHFSS